MSRIRIVPTLALLATLAVPGCSGDSPVAPGAPPPDGAASAPGNSRIDAARERLAAQFARALSRPDVRAAVHAAVRTSRFPEGKVALDRFLAAEHGRLRSLVRAASGAQPDLVAAGGLELYFPVPEHQAAWDGSRRILVGTIGDDGEVPVAFSTDGRRLHLDPSEPPATPVLAIVPRETDFTTGPSLAAAAPGDDEPGETPGLYLTRAHYNDDFESWLKGLPEFEVLALGQKGSTDSLSTYQCTSERAPGAYYYNQDQKDWSGSVLVLSQAQLDNYRAVHAGQAMRLFFVEDDDTRCVIKSDPADLHSLIASVDSLVDGLAGGTDVWSVAGRTWRSFPIAQKVLSVAASLIKTNDDLVGNAVEDVTTAERYAGHNWIVKGKHGQTNGYVKLEVR
ncbi:MAG TPA: hypothetical protein VFS94_06190 [Gemmatimonadales bacterium]|nr:hypothetical protein [Gemmatimonadales bacterium]